MISADPNTVTVISRIREAVRTLKTEMRGLNDEANKVAIAFGKIGGVGRLIVGKGTLGGTQRVGNFPEIMPLNERLAQEHNVGRTPIGVTPPGTGTGQPAHGGHDAGLVAAVLLPQIMRVFSSQLGAVIQRERITTRLAMAQPGVYSGQQAAQPWQQMLRQTATGYASTGDLYAGAGALGQAGLLRTARRGQPGFDQTQRIVRETGLAAIQGGTDFQTAAQTIAGFRDPSIVNALRQGMVGGRSITTPFAGGGMQLYGRRGLLEQVYGGLGGGKRGEDFYRTGLAAGNPLSNVLTGAGFGKEQQELVQQYGLMRAEHPDWNPEKVQKEIQKRYKDTGQTLIKFQESVSDLKDVFVTGLLPVVQGVVMVLQPLAKTIRTLGDRFPPLVKALGAAAAALFTFAAVTKLATLAQGLGRGMAAAGIPGGGMIGGAGGLLGKAAGPLAVAAGGYVLGEGAQQVISGGQTKGARAVGGRIAGGAFTGLGLGTSIALGLTAISGGVLAPSVPIFAGVGAVLGGVAGALGVGDAWSDAVAAGGSSGAPTTPSGGPASGKDLRGAKATDANMNADFASRLQQMFADNPRLSLTSGWRDPATQARLYKEKPNLAAPPGKSNHEKGLAADIGPPSEYGWIATNMGKYGLTLPMPDTADRKAKGKKIEPWHVEPSGAGGMVTTLTAAVSGGTPTTASTPTTPTKTKAAASPESRGGSSPGAGAYQEAMALMSVLGGAQIGDAWEGDNTVVFPGTSGGGVQVGRGGSTISIGKIEINLTIARGTYEEAERTARYLGTLLGDRERMLSLARGGNG